MVAFNGRQITIDDADGRVGVRHKTREVVVDIDTGFGLYSLAMSVEAARRLATGILAGVEWLETGRRPSPKGKRGKT